MRLATRDILMSKVRKITKHQTPWTPWIKSGLKWPKNDKKYDKNCISKVSRVNFWAIGGSGKFGLIKGTGVDPPPTRGENPPFFFFFFDAFP